MAKLKYLITKPRYLVDPETGLTEYKECSVESPAEVFVEQGDKPEHKVDDHLIPTCDAGRAEKSKWQKLHAERKAAHEKGAYSVGVNRAEDVPGQKLKPHFVQAKAPEVKSSVEVQGKKGARVSDSDV